MAHDHTSLDNIKCPNCGELIPVSQTIYHQIAEQARADLRAEALERQKALAEKEKALEARENAVDQVVESRVNAAMIARAKEAEKKARETVLVEVEDLKRQNAEREQKLQEAREAELNGARRNGSWRSERRISNSKPPAAWTPSGRRSWRRQPSEWRRNTGFARRKKTNSSRTRCELTTNYAASFNRARNGIVTLLGLWAGICGRKCPS
jgi:hypothetical protein